MISREEALKMFIDFAEEEWSLSAYEANFLPEIAFVNKIYDSIGTCGECKHFSKNYNQCNLHLSPSGIGIDMLEKDYCSYFKRKTNV